MSMFISNAIESPSLPEYPSSPPHCPLYANCYPLHNYQCDPAFLLAPAPTPHPTTNFLQSVISKLPYSHHSFYELFTIFFLLHWKFGYLLGVLPALHFPPISMYHRTWKLARCPSCSPWLPYYLLPWSTSPLIPPCHYLPASLPSVVLLPSLGISISHLLSTSSVILLISHLETSAATWMTQQHLVSQFLVLPHSKDFVFLPTSTLFHDHSQHAITSNCATKNIPFSDH